LLQDEDSESSNKRFEDSFNEDTDDLIRTDKGKAKTKKINDTKDNDTSQNMRSFD